MKLKISVFIKYTWILFAILTSCLTVYVSFLLINNDKSAVDCWLGALVCLGILNPLMPPVIIFLFFLTNSIISSNHWAVPFINQIIIQTSIIFSYIQWFIVLPWLYSKICRLYKKIMEK